MSDRFDGRWGWAVLFAILILLSFDFWWWETSTGPGPLGLPWWIVYFIALQGLLAAAILAFSHRYWRDDPEGEDGP